MAVLNAVTVADPSNGVVRNRPFNGFAQDRPRAKVWANWSIIVGGEPIPLPLGQAIDTMEMASTTGQNVAVVKLNHSKNKVLAAFQSLGASMEPGETMIIGDATIEGNVVCHLRRVSDDVKIPQEEGDLDVGGIVSLLKPRQTALEKALANDKGDPGESLAQMQAHIADLTAKIAKATAKA